MEESNMTYCPSCGMIQPYIARRCCICGDVPIFKINPKWGITKEKYHEIMDQSAYGEKTIDQCHQELDDFCSEFYEEVVKKRPEFNEYNFTHKWELDHERYLKEVAEFEKSKAESNARAARTNRSVSSSVSCPYCQSYNTHKISVFSKAANTAVFGIFGQKRKYQWHCNNCNSDF